MMSAAGVPCGHPGRESRSCDAKPAQAWLVFLKGEGLPPSGGGRGSYNLLHYATPSDNGLIRYDLLKPMTTHTTNTTAQIRTLETRRILGALRTGAHTLNRVTS